MRDEYSAAGSGAPRRGRTSCRRYFCRWLLTCWIVSPSMPSADDMRLTIPCCRTRVEASAAVTIQPGASKRREPS